MKKLIGFAIAGLVLSVPAHGQRAMMGSAAPTGGAGGGIGGVPTGGGSAVSFHTLPSYPPTQFQMIEVSGGDVSFVPSSFVQFEKSVAQGEAALAIRQEPLAEVALENRLVERPKSKLMITQDHFGYAILERQ